MSTVYTKRQPFAAEMDTRSCIWWGVLCAWDAFRSSDDGKAKEALNVCVRWHQDPNEVNRLAASAQLTDTSQDSAIQMLLRAIFFTGNIAPVNCPEVRLKPESAKFMVASCLDLLLAKVPAMQREIYAQRFEQLASELELLAV